MGAIGGGPTFLGTLLRHGFTSEPLSVAATGLLAGFLTDAIVSATGL
jgi:zinc transporter, ZIP family